MANLPTVAPWTIPFTRMIRSRLLVVANSSVTWSVTETEYYCQRRGIPLSNIVYLALGNGGSPTTYDSIYEAGTWANVLATIVTPVATKARQLFAQGIILGPGVPVGCQFPSYAGPLQVAPMTDVVRLIGYPGPPNEPFGTLYADDRGGGRVAVTNGGFIPLEMGVGPNGAWENPTSVVDTATTYSLPLSPSAGNVDLPIGGTQSLDAVTDTKLGHPVDWYALDNNTVDGNLALKFAGPCPPIGRVGASSLGGGYLGNPPYAETQAFVRDLIDRATAQMAAHSVGEARRKPILFNLTTADGGTATGARWSYFRTLCEGWGLNTKYAYYNPAGHRNDTKAMSAPGSAAYTALQLEFGEVIDFEYYLMVGGWDNVNFYDAPYANAWKPQPGAGVLMGPSNGFQVTNRALERGALAGRGDMTHATTATLTADLSTLHNLLRGMTWMEAMFFSQPMGHAPIGDPLWAPFGFDNQVFSTNNRNRKISIPRLRK
jgi:hypothetical protein